MTATAKTNATLKTCFITDGKYKMANEEKAITLDEIKKWGKFLRRFGYAVSFRSEYDERTELPECIVELLEVLRAHRPSISIDGVVTDWLDITPDQYVGIAGTMLSKMQKDGIRRNSVLGWCFDGEYKSELEALFFVCDYMPIAMIGTSFHKSKKVREMMIRNYINGNLVYFQSNHVWTNPNNDKIVDFTSDEIADGMVVWETGRLNFLKWRKLEIRYNYFNNSTGKTEVGLEHPWFVRNKINEQLDKEKEEDNTLAQKKAEERFFALSKEIHKKYLDLLCGRFNGGIEELSRMKKQIRRLRALCNRAFEWMQEDNYIKCEINKYEELVDEAMKNPVKEERTEINWPGIALWAVISVVWLSVGAFIIANWNY